MVLRQQVSLPVLLVRHTARSGYPSLRPESTHDSGRGLTRDACRRTSHRRQTDLPRNVCSNIEKPII